MHQERALIAAIKFFGSQTNLAKTLKISRKKLNNWLNRGDEIPFQYAIAIEKLTEGTVNRYALAPYATWLKNLYLGDERKCKRRH